MIFQILVLYECVILGHFVNFTYLIYMNIVTLT